MLFNSLMFAFFFVAVVAVYFVLPHRARWVLLLVASYWFYMSWKAEYAVLIAFTTGINYACGLAIARSTDRRRRALYLWVSVAASLGVLFLFKYANFVNGALRSVLAALELRWEIGNLEVLLPVGISFFTFQSLGYAVDVYRGTKEPERHLGHFAVYVAFFPQLVAGPIERASRLCPQFREVHELDYERVRSGLGLALWGLFKKVVVADRLAIIVDATYQAPELQGTPALLVATYFFAFQIYCDFSGYSDIAVGTARVLGFDLMVNFRRPYFATSVADFWRRWHISLSTWFRDYVYLPLGGNQVSRSRWIANIAVVFLLSGLWHGAAWTFVVWGGLHGGCFIVSRLTKRPREALVAAVGLDRVPRLLRVIRVVTTFHLVLAGWVFFRAASFEDAFAVFRNIAAMDFSRGVPGSLAHVVYGTFGIVALLLLELPLRDRAGTVSDWLQTKATGVRWAYYVLTALVIMAIGVFDGGQFIYFQF